METVLLKTPLQLEREKRDTAIYKEWNELTAQPGASRISVAKHLMSKYNIYSLGTIYTIKARMERKLKEKEEQL